MVLKLTNYVKRNIWTIVKMAIIASYPALKTNEKFRCYGNLTLRK